MSFIPTRSVTVTTHESWIKLKAPKGRDAVEMILSIEQARLLEARLRHAVQTAQQERRHPKWFFLNLLRK